MAMTGCGIECCSGFRGAVVEYLVEVGCRYVAVLVGGVAAFADQTGAPPALLNTSFNHEAEPIVCTPQDVLRTFYASPLDVLAISGFLICKDDHRQGRQGR